MVCGTAEAGTNNSATGPALHAGAAPAPPKGKVVVQSFDGWMCCNVLARIGVSSTYAVATRWAGAR